MSKDYYKILGVEKSASKEEIKKAYKSLAKKYHPDISKEKDAEAKFKEINEAAGVLLDDEKRKTYDTYGTTQGPSGFGGFGGGNGGFNPSDFGINLDDIFEQFGFGGFSGSSGFNRRSRQVDTSIHEELDVSLDDVYFGVKKTIKVSREIKCSTCSGKGAENPRDVETCPVCGGSGIVIETQRSILGSIRTQRPCSNCGGSGEIIKNPCSTCSGKGAVLKKEELEVKIPEGIENGVTLRVSGKGNYNKETDSYGDLYLRIYVKKHKVFDVDGNDLYMSLNVNFIQAILGDEVEFDHFGKTLSLKVPEGTQPGSVLRLKGKGLPYFNYDGHGDLYVKIGVDMPKKTTAEQKSILMDYAKTMKDKSFLDRLKNFFK